MHRTIRMAERLTGDGYRKIHESEYQARKDRLFLEGVDGDEQENTVTYWYALTPKEY